LAVANNKESQIGKDIGLHRILVFFKLGKKNVYRLFWSTKSN